MTTKWENFVKRRNINVKRFLETHSIMDPNTLFQKLREMGVEPPDSETVSSMFPKPKFVEHLPKEKNEEKEESGGSPPTRSEDGQGDRNRGDSPRSHDSQGPKRSDRGPGRSSR